MQINKIDCHTHIVSKELADEYFSRSDSYAVVMQFPDSIMSNPDTFATVMSNDRLFLCPFIDLKEAVPDPGSGSSTALKKRLDFIAERLDEAKIVGLKIYTSYQRGHADDESLFPVYEFAAKHKLAVTFHTGLCSLVLPTDNDLEGSSAPHIAAAAERYPEISFIAAHMDDPHFDRCMDLVAQHPNLFTDISGAYETGTAFGDDIDAAIALFRHATDRHPECSDRILYGTDFCPPISLAQLDEYDYSLNKMFAPELHRDILVNNALRAFPRLRELLGQGDNQ